MKNDIQSVILVAINVDVLIIEIEKSFNSTATRP